ncbi:MAG: hypothetical protein ISR58_08940 [Anaerolineales bacterium]|nr:hypothetical protein [Chloroflexota bacterium]MBL6981303.1 hypothetical protein [Anaerolineales bacterium]
MVQKSLELGKAPKLTIEHIAGDLHVKGWKRTEALIKTTCDDLVTFEQGEEITKIDCPEDCIVYVPFDATLQVKQVDGSARFRALGGMLEIGQIAGPLTLREVGSVEAGSVGGPLSARSVRGDLKIKTVAGSARVRDIDGQFHADSIGGNLRLGDVSGGISAVVVGNAKLSIAPVPWQAYSVSSSGNLSCQIPDDINADVTLESGAHSIRIKLPNSIEKIQQASYSLELGDGGTFIKLTASGKIDLIAIDAESESQEDFDLDFNFDFELGEDFSKMAKDMARQATEQVETHLKSLETQLSGLSKTLEDAGLSEERSKEIHQRVEDARARASQRAQEAAQRAQHKIERKLASAQRKVAREARRSARTKSMHIDIDALRSAKQSSSDPISDEERMMILQMLQEGKVSVEQAEDLLAALEGKGQ